MVKIRETPTSGSVASGPVKRGPWVITVQIPRDPATGGLLQGDIRDQARCVFEGLKQAMHEAGGTLSHIMLVQIFLITATDWAAMNEVWKEFFTEAPFPERATIIAKELARPEMRIEIIAFAHVDAA